MEYTQKLRAIAHNLEKCDRVTKHSTKEENQAHTLAHAFADIEESLSIIIKEQIPSLYLKNLSQEAVDDLILEIGEEFRHILYHIHDTKVYHYLSIDEK